MMALEKGFNAGDGYTESIKLSISFGSSKPLCTRKRICTTVTKKEVNYYK